MVQMLTIPNMDGAKTLAMIAICKELKMVFTTVAEVVHLAPFIAVFWLLIIYINILFNCFAAYNQVGFIPSN